MASTVRKSTSSKKYGCIALLIGITFIATSVLATYIIHYEFPQQFMAQNMPAVATFAFVSLCALVVGFTTIFGGVRDIFNPN